MRLLRYEVKVDDAVITYFDIIMIVEYNLLVNIVVVFIVRSISQQNTKSRSEREENLSSCVYPHLGNRNIELGFSEQKYN